MRQVRASRRRSDRKGNEALCPKGKFAAEGRANGYTTLHFHKAHDEIGAVKSGSLGEGSDQGFQGGPSIEAIPQHIDTCT